MVKLLLIVTVAGALASGLAGPHKQPPLLIDSHPAPFAQPPLDAAD
jgi:hypothetical protein